VTALATGRSHVPDVPREELQALLRAGRYQATTDAAVLADSDAVLICVPTPLGKSKDPDISYVIAAAKEAAARFHPGQLIILESTTYPEPRRSCCCRCSRRTERASARTSSWRSPRSASTPATPPSRSGTSRKWWEA